MEINQLRRPVHIAEKKSSMLKSAKDKGMRLEYMWVEKLKDSGIDQYARRSIMSGAVFEPGDIKTNIPIVFECKNYQKMAIYKFWDQCLREVQGTNKTPALVMKANDKPILIAMNGDDYLEILDYALKGGYGKS